MKILPFLLLPGLLLTVVSCKKDKENEPSKTAMLTAVTWRDNSTSLVLNGTEGTQTTPTATAGSYKFTTDGKVTYTTAGGAATNGTWALQNNDSQIVLTGLSNGSTSSTYQVFTLAANSLSIGYSFDQAQIQAAVAGTSGSNSLIPLLLLSAGSFTFAAGTPTIPAAQLTSLQYKTNLVAR